MQQKQKATGLVWLNNNLRISDNQALKLACENHEKVIAIYIFDKNLFTDTLFGFKKIEKYRAQFLLETVTDLKQNLETKNITLLTYFDYPVTVIPQIIKEHLITDIYLQKEWTPEEVAVINKVKNKTNLDIKFHEVYDQFLFHPNDVSKNFNNIPEVFTAFRKKLEKYVAIRNDVFYSKKEASNLLKNKTEIPTLKQLGFDDFVKSTKSAFPFKGGENEALKRLDHYFFASKKLSFYKKTRNGLIGTDYSSKFSAWLANGSISAKTIYWKVKEYEAQFGSNQSTYWLIFELIWRDYFKYISLKHKNSIFKLEGILKKKYTWNDDENLVKSWINGETQEPFVNANMLELKATGFMSNRGRQNVASYFSKELLLDWRIGAAYFESMLIDYDVHSNYGNWMYVSGVGNDPRDRKFNIKMQAERYDPQQKYQNLWLQKTIF